MSDEETGHAIARHLADYVLLWTTRCLTLTLALSGPPGATRPLAASPPHPSPLTAVDLLNLALLHPFLLGLFRHAGLNLLAATHMP